MKRNPEFHLHITNLFILFSYLCKALWFNLTKFIEKQEISSGHFLVLIFFSSLEK